MNYAKFSNQPFVTKSDVQMRRKVSAEARSIRAYCEGHNFSIRINPVTKEGAVTVTKKNER